MDLQNGKSRNFRNFETPDLGDLGKMTLGAALIASHREYYKGEDGGLSQVRDVVNLVSSCMPVTCLCTKSVSTMH